MPVGFHPLYLALLLVIVFVIFGPRRLAEIGGAIGRGIRELRKVSDHADFERAEGKIHQELAERQRQQRASPSAATRVPVGDATPGDGTGSGGQAGDER